MNVPQVRQAYHVSKKSPEAQLRDAMLANGLRYDGEITYDGNFIRFSTSETDRNDKSGWLVLFDDPIKCGAFGDWRRDLIVKWRVEDYGLYDAAMNSVIDKKMAEAQKLAAEKKNAVANATQEYVLKMWQKAKPCLHHPYLEKKKVGAYNLRECGNTLCVPLFDQAFEIRSMQEITQTEDGVFQKKFVENIPTKGLFYYFPRTSSASVTTPLLCEGFATGASIHEATGAEVFCAMSAGNLSAIAKIIHRNFGIVSDNDNVPESWSESERNLYPHGPGEKGARACGADEAQILIIPREIGGVYHQEISDANDYVNAGGDLAGLLVSKFPKMRIVDIEELLMRPHPLKWLVEDWIPEKSLGMIIGQPSAGKSTLAIDMMMCIASGTKWHGKTCRKANILYCVGEGKSGIPKRVKAWTISNKTETEKGHFKVLPEAIDFDKDGDFAALADEIEQCGMNPDIIVIDTLNAYMAGDENSEQDARSVINKSRQLINQFGASVLIVHHSGNNPTNATRARGSSAFRGAMDFQIVIVREENSVVSKVWQTKMKEAEEQRPMWFELGKIEITDWPKDDYGRFQTGVVLKQIEEPVKEREDSIKNIITEVAKRYGIESDGRILISKDSMKTYLQNEMNLKPNQVKCFLRTDSKSRPMVLAERRGWIADLNNGYWEVKI